jgi:hypothetical protein
MKQAIELAENIRKPLKPDAKDRDLTDFVMGASFFNLGRTEEAQKELASHCPALSAEQVQGGVTLLRGIQPRAFEEVAGGRAEARFLQQGLPGIRIHRLCAAGPRHGAFPAREYQKCLDVSPISKNAVRTCRTSTGRWRCAVTRTSC